jgi:Flp pilus assembly protein TadB
MPNRYEREIEEILRNLEQTEPKTGRAPKFGDRQRRKQNVRRTGNRRATSSLHLSITEWLLVTAVITALVAGGYAYMQEPNIVTGILASVSLICLILIALSHFVFNRSRPQATRYGNVTITPLRRNIFSSIKTQWNLFMLKMRYRRRSKP